MSKVESKFSTQNPFYEANEAEEKEEEMPKIDLKPTIIILISGILGLALGIGLADGRGGEDIVSWVKLPGVLFINALKCVVLPLIFVNIILASVGMYKVGKVGSVAYKTLGLYLLTTFFASLIGLIFVLMFKNSFEVKESPVEDVGDVTIQCPFRDLITGDATFVSEDEATGKLICTSEKQEVFILNNSNGFLLEQIDPLEEEVTFSQTVQDGIFRKLISDNITAEFVRENFAGIIVFAVLIGVSSQKLKTLPRVILELLEELDRVFIKVIDWIIFLTPIAVFSLIAGNLGEQEDIADAFKNIGVFTTCVLLALAVHMFVFYPLLYVATVKENPFIYMKFLLPAQIFGFASSSSAATLPLTLDCVAATKQVPASVANFVLSMGATINMDGGAIYFPAALTFIAIAEGFEDELNASTFFMMILLATIGSAGTAPIPSSGQVIILTAYNTVFSKSGVPRTFELILAIDWFIDRFRAVVNITGDALVARMVVALAKVGKDIDQVLDEAMAGEERIVSLR